MTEKEHDIPKLTDVELARWQAMKSVIGSLADGVRRGALTGDEAAAINAQMESINLDMDKVRDALHVPEDAGEHADALEAMLRRIPDGWGRWISCSAGWYPLITRLDTDLAALDADYVLYQVKEKYGGLHFCAHTDVEGVADAFDELIRDAEGRSVRTCELCGAAGGLRVRRRWYKTLCDLCAEADPRGRWGCAKP